MAYLFNTSPLQISVDYLNSKGVKHRGKFLNTLQLERYFQCINRRMALVTTVHSKISHFGRNVWTCSCIKYVFAYKRNTSHFSKLIER